MIVRQTLSYIFVLRTLFLVLFVGVIWLSLIDFRGSTAPFGMIANGNIKTVYLPQKEFYDNLNPKNKRYACDIKVTL